MGPGQNCTKHHKTEYKSKKRNSCNDHCLYTFTQSRYALNVTISSASITNSQFIDVQHSRAQLLDILRNRPLIMHQNVTFALNIYKIFWGGDVLPPQTPLPVGRGTPPSHTLSSSSPNFENVVAPLVGVAVRTLLRSFASENQSPLAIMWACLREPKFSRFDTIPACDGHKDRLRDTRRQRVPR